MFANASPAVSGKLETLDWDLLLFSASLQAIVIRDCGGTVHAGCCLMSNLVQMTPEQKATAERLAQLTMMPSNGAVNVASSASAPCLVQELCKADMDNTLQLLLDEEQFLDAPECSGPAKSAAAPDPAKAEHSLSQRSL